jgi:hypothetical protein
LAITPSADPGHGRNDFEALLRQILFDNVPVSRINVGI